MTPPPGDGPGPELDRSRARTARIRNAYTTVAESYDRLVPDTGFEAAVDLALVELFVTEVGGGAVLDAGCGAGRMLTRLEQLDPGLELVGVDLAPGMVTRARAHHPSRVVEEADLAALPFEDGRFDGVLCWYSLIHVPTAELPDVVAELGRVLRPGGLLLLGFHAGSGERVATRAYGHEVELPVQRHDPQSVAQTLDEAGFELRARLDRAARPVEQDAQAVLLAARRSPVGEHC